MTDQDARKWASGAHLAWLVTVLGIPPVIGPLIVWLLKKDEHPFVDDQGKEALNFQLSILIYGFIAVVAVLTVGVLTLGLGLIALLPVAAPVALLFAIAVLVLPIVAAIKAREGVRYRYPLTLRLIA